MQDGLKLMPGIGIGEYAPAQGSTIQGTICLHHLIAECCPDRFQRHLPGAVKARAMTSVSITGTPCPANKSATVDLPEPIPQ